MRDEDNLAGRFERLGDEPALVVGTRTITARELTDRVARWRGGLASAGVRAGDRVAVIAANNDDFVAGHLATMGIGAISVPLNPQSPPAELARELTVVDPFAAVIDRAANDTFVAALAEAPALEVQRLTAAELDQGGPHPIVAVEASSPAALLFTSGTAGPPKPAVLSHGNLTAALQAMLSLPIELVGRDHVVLGVMPLFHVLGLNVVLHLGLLVGATVVLGDYAGPQATAELIERHGVTVVAAPPTLWRAMARADGVTRAQFSSVVLAVSGAAKLPPLLKVEVADRLGLDLSEGYGLTESSAVVASSIVTAAPLGSVGRLLPGVEARIVDEDERDCLVGDAGELWVRGPMVFAGYWGSAPGARSPLTEDGWLRTGDVAIVDEDGYLAIVDRTKDLIIVSGFNVFPAEVELVLVSHPSVAQACVIGEPSETTGEAIVAHVVGEGGADVDTEALRRHCRQQLARYKVPSRFVVAAELPIGPTGKLQRDRLG